LKPTQKQIFAAVGRLGALAMFPSDPAAREGIMRAIERFVNTVEELKWLVETMMDKVGVWHGPTELRGVFCSHFKPADGGEDTRCVTTPGFTAYDQESRYFEREAAETTKRIAEWKQQAKALPAAEEWENKQLTEQIAERLAIKAEPLPKPKPIPIGPTPIRTEEQRVAELRKLEEQLAARQTSRPN
jgi:hypothetical protein